MNINNLVKKGIIYQLFLISRFKKNPPNNLHIKEILKYIEPCFDCECPTCDINVKPNAVVDCHDKIDEDVEYEEYCLKNDDHKWCECPNCFNICGWGEEEAKKRGIKYYVKNLDIEGRYFYTYQFSPFPSSHHIFLMNNNTFRCYTNIDDYVGIIDDTMDKKELHRSNRQFRQDLKCKIPEHFQYENVEQLVHFYFRNFPDKYSYFLECLNKIK